MNEFFPQRDYLGRIGFSFKNIRVTLVHAPGDRGRFLRFAPDVIYAPEQEPSGIVVSITEGCSISDGTALRIAHAMLLAATGARADERPPCASIVSTARCGSSLVACG